MRKMIVGIAAVAAIVGIRRAGHMGRNMREHWGQMAAQCKQMASQFGGRGEPFART